MDLLDLYKLEMNDSVYYANKLGEAFNAGTIAFNANILPAVDNPLYSCIVSRRQHEQAITTRDEVISETTVILNRIQTYYNALSSSIHHSNVSTGNLTREIWLSEQNVPENDTTWNVMLLLEDESNKTNGYIEVNTELENLCQPLSHLRLSTKRCAQKVVNIYNTSKMLFTKKYENQPLNVKFVCELHSYIMNGLTEPGQFRRVNVKPSVSSTVYPDYSLVGHRLVILLKFYEERRMEIKNREIESQFHRFKSMLFLTAIFTEAFLFLHPFRNGNGRVARLLFAHILRHEVGAPHSFYCNNSCNHNRREQRELYIKALDVSRITGHAPIAFIRYVFECMNSHLCEKL